MLHLFQCSSSIVYLQHFSNTHVTLSLNYFLGYNRVRVSSHELLRAVHFAKI